MVLCDNFDSLILKENEIFYIINKSIFVEKTINKISDGAILDIIRSKNCFSVQFFFFAINFEPFKEIIVCSIKCTKLCFEPIGKHTNLIERKEIRNISHVIFQILVVGFLDLNNAIFQFNEHKRHAIDKNKDIRSAIIDLSLYPHLRYCSESVILRMLKVYQLNKIKIFFAIPTNCDFYIITNLPV